MCQRARATAKPCDAPADAADLALVALEGFQLRTIPQLDALAGRFVFNELVRRLIAPDLERLFQRLMAFLARDDDGAELELHHAGEEGTVGVQGIGDDHIEPREGLLDPLDEPRRRRQLA